jgi:hypothetical protein
MNPLAKKGRCVMKLNVLAFGLTCGIVWGLGVFCLAWWVMAFEGATKDPTLLGHIYRGFSISPLGSVVGLAWGLCDGFGGGVVFAWVYNSLVGRRSARNAPPAAK